MRLPIQAIRNDIQVFLDLVDTEFGINLTKVIQLNKTMPENSWLLLDTVEI